MFAFIRKMTLFSGVAVLFCLPTRKYMTVTISLHFWQQWVLPSFSILFGMQWYFIMILIWLSLMNYFQTFVIHYVISGIYKWTSISVIYKIPNLGPKTFSISLHVSVLFLHPSMCMPSFQKNSLYWICCLSLSSFLKTCFIIIFHSLAKYSFNMFM